MLEEEPVETIHVYIVRENEEQPIVDSTAQDTAKIDTQPLVVKSYPMRLRLVPYLIIAAHLLTVLAAFSMHFYTLLTETATITIVPKSYHLTTQLTLSNTQSRIFQPQTLTQTKTVPATGKGHQDATAATGTITLYNAAPSEQTIDAGTLFIGNDGVHIVTDQIAIIEGATPPLEGQTTVRAHVVNPGAAGNIQAGDIQGACCRENIFAYSSAFSGGSDQRDYTIVTKQDIASVISSVVPTLTKQINASFDRQIRPGEIPTPNQCSQKISPDRNVGDEASNVTVTVSESCTAAAYNQHSLQMQVTIAFLHYAETLVSTGYMLHLLHPTITNVLLKDGSLRLRVLCQGDLIYHVSPQELQRLRGELAGKTRQQGIAILSQLNGVDHISVQLGKNGTFPVDSAHITFLFAGENTA